MTVAFCALCSVPYGVAALRAPSGARFTGLLLNHFDQDYYRAAQRSTAEALPHANRFTSEAGAPGPGPPLYPLLGRVQRLTGLPPAVVYHLPRVLATVALPILLVHLYSLCFPGRREPAMWAVLFALFAAGVLTFAPGLAIAHRSGEAIPESNIVYSLSVFPHFAISYLGITLAFTSLAMALRGHSLARVAAAATGSGVLLGIGHSFLLLPFLAVLAGFVLVVAARPVLFGVPSTGLGRLAATAAVLVPAAPFVYGLHRAQARLERLQGFAFPTSHPDRWWTWAMGFGIVSVLAVMGAVSLLRSRWKDQLTWMLLGWAVAQSACIYLSFTPFQRRFSEGLIVPVAGLAGAGAALIRGSDLAGRAIRGGIVAVLVVGALSIADGLGASGEYVSSDLAALAATVRSSDVVLAGHRVSAVLPAISDGTSHAGRPVETLHYLAKRDGATRYALRPTAAAARRWLASQGITLVVVNRKDRSFLPQGLDDPAQACLTPAFERGDLVAYRVQAGCLTGG
ncbi:MAG: hypothetical protein ACR2MO_10960 [Acidimicrobiales bacterium]